MDSFFFEVSNYSVNMYNFNISMCLSKATFSSLQTIKVTFLILHHFPVVVLPLCLPVVLCREPARPRSAEDPEDMSPFWHGATELGSHG